MLQLTRIRRARGLSKAALARMANLDQALLSKIESGRVLPYTCELTRLATALGVANEDAAALLSSTDTG